jgi:protein TonB
MRGVIAALALIFGAGAAAQTARLEPGQFKIRYAPAPVAGATTPEIGPNAGEVVLELTLDPRGDIVGIFALAGPEELRPAALRVAAGYGFIAGPRAGRVRVVFSSADRKATVAEEPVRVDPKEQQQKLISSVPPAYPALARQAGISGTVRLEALIGRDGRVKGSTVLSGHPLLARPASEALSKWIYAPTLANGRTVEVLTTVDIHFTLSP